MWFSWRSLWQREGVAMTKQREKLLSGCFQQPLELWSLLGQSLPSASGPFSASLTTPDAPGLFS